MRVRSLDLFHVAVPLRKAIKHASHARTTSDNLVVRVTLDDGTVGHGEGVPRDYVTGETIDTTFATLSRLDVGRQIGVPSDMAAVVESLTRLSLPETEADPRGMAGNAARCALELAVLDAYGRRLGVSAGEAVPLGVAAIGGGDHWRLNGPGSVRYSGAITAESKRKELISAIKMRVYGFRQVKVKVGVRGQDDPKRLKRLRWFLGRRMDVRIDANEAWSADEVMERVGPLRPYRPSALEQPVPHAQADTLADLRPALGVPIMLDESLCGLPDARRAINLGTADLFNVRLSKCGGLVPSLRIMDLAFRSGLGVQLGCHPGETGLLSAAGRHLASRVGGLRYVEGSYDRHVLAWNIIDEDITFRYGGKARPLAGPGLGVNVCQEALAAITVRRQEVRYD
jgi:muconate cycloisomerase